MPLEHEFDPFVISLLNAAGAGDIPDEVTLAKIAAIKKPLDLKIAAGLDCPRCRNTIIPAERVAALNEHVTAQIYDLAHFPALQERYNILSVPCLIANDGEIVKPGGTVNSMSDLLEVLAPYLE